MHSLVSRCSAVTSRRVAQLSACGAETGYTTGANNCIIRWRALDNDRRVSGRIPRVNSDGFTTAGEFTLSGLLAGRLENHRSWQHR